MPKHYSIMLNFGGDPKVYHPKIQAALEGLGSDWLRFADYQYIVASDSTAHAIYEAVRPQIPSDGNILVVAISLSDRWGWASQLVGDWVKKYAP